MTSRKMLDGNEGVARVAYLASEVIAIYPITPSSGMGELSDQFASEGKKNLWGTVPQIIEMQSEGGVAGTVHGALQAGSLATTFTASQGLLLMIPDMYKIAGELTPTVFHIAARALAAQALSIFGDHSDVMATRQTGWAMLASSSVQEAQDLAVVAHMATLASRVPFIHFFDGFRTSHETNKIDLIEEGTIRALIDEDAIAAHRSRALSPDRPSIRGTAQNPDVYFQGREAGNAYYAAVPGIVQTAMERFAEETGRHYQLFDYVGVPDAERVIVMMGSGAEAAHELVEYLTDRGEKVGLVKVRLYRPFDVSAVLAAMPTTVRAIAVLDRTKEPGAAGEPLYQDVLTALVEDATSESPRFAKFPVVVGGRYGLSSKEFTPTMAKAVFDNLAAVKPRNHFTVGINDDVTHTSLPLGEPLFVESADSVRAVFYGLGADGTVGANKNSIKIIGEETDLEAQAYFIYDSKKSGSVTVSHLRFGPKRIRSTYLIDRATFVACHQFGFLERLDVLSLAEPGATVLLNAPFGPDELWDNLPVEAQEQIIEKRLRVFTVDALKVAGEAGLGGRINTVMQVCFFALSNVLPREVAIAKIKDPIRNSYGKRGESVVAKNVAAVDAALAHLHEVTVPAATRGNIRRLSPMVANAPAFVSDVLGMITAGRGNELPVSAMPIDGTFPCATSQYEKRNIGTQIPQWEEDLCIQCGKCVLVCPHATIRAKLYDPALLADAPEGFKSANSKFLEAKDHKYTLQVAPEDCTGCSLCVDVCPAKNKSRAGQKAINMVPQALIRDRERRAWDFFLWLPEYDRTAMDLSRVKNVSLLRPLFEFSGACAGCGETPYLKMMSQLFGDRAMIANATGCSSIYGGNLPTTPWAKDAQGRGPAWANSLFEDNAEFGLGMRLSLDKQREEATELLRALEGTVHPELVAAIMASPEVSETHVRDQRVRVATLKQVLSEIDRPEARRLALMADSLVRKSVWIVGGDGWAYDIGYGGLDHVMASGRDVNILVLDTEVYSNTGGQQSKSTPRGAVAKFAAAGKRTGKKDLAALAISYGNTYVARVAFGSNDAQTLKAFREADAWRGPSLILAYSHCIAHGFDLSKGVSQQKAAVDSGHWPLLRYDPARRERGENPMQIDSKAPSLPLESYIYNEARYSSLVATQPEVARQLLVEARADIRERWNRYESIVRLNEPAVAPEGGQS